MFEALIPLFDQLSTHPVSHVRLKCILNPNNPKQIDPQLGGEKQFRKLIQHLKIKLPHMGLIIESPYPHIQSGIPLVFTPKSGFYFQAKTQVFPVLLRDYLDIMSHLKNNLADKQLMPHEIKHFENLIHTFESQIIKNKKPDLSLFANLNLWFSACPARKKLIKNYLENLPKSHYEAFFPKSRLDEWHLKEPSLITLD
ncbi:MAG: hypothetical protein WCK49_03325 [Myxococcaceae bacterium]